VEGPVQGGLSLICVFAADSYNLNYMP